MYNEKCVNAIAYTYEITCHFLQDCEHTVLATKIIHLLGREGPKTPNPSKYIRFIYNRVILENEAVRAG